MHQVESLAIVYLDLAIVGMKPTLWLVRVVLLLYGHVPHGTISAWLALAPPRLVESRDIHDTRGNKPKPGQSGVPRLGELSIYARTAYRALPI
jgi:hypothetical protein